jgi:hypothetical protein
MNKLRAGFVLMGALGAGVVYAQAQTQTTPQPVAPATGAADSTSDANRGSPSIVSPPGSNGAAAGSVQKPKQESAMLSAKVGGGPQQIASGMDVKSKTGASLGKVADVIKASSGKPAYIVIADQSGSDSAVPYSIARHMVHGNSVVIDDQQLKGAPKVPGDQLRSPTQSGWKTDADTYWNKQAKDQG